MGRIKGLQRGYAVSYCKTVKDCIALACTDGSVPISYTLFIKHSAQPTKLQSQSRTVCRGRTFSFLLSIEDLLATSASAFPKRHTDRSPSPRGYQKFVGGFVVVDPLSVVLILTL